MSRGPLTAFEERFFAATPTSRALAEQASLSLAGGVSRSGMPYLGYPLFIDHAEGAYLHDVDGNAYLDMSNGHSAMPLGHRPARVVEAVARQLERGLGYGLMDSSEVRLASMLQQRIPSMERLRFTASGTEATMFAVRLARAFTGRTLFARMEGSYHGPHDMMCSGMTVNLGGAWPGADEHPVGNGVHPSVADGVVFLPFNDLEACTQIIEAQASRIAAIIVEPFIGGGGGIPADPDFLAGLRHLCDRLGMLLIFDEMISIGLSQGGAQGYYGVRADLTASGKLVGGGMPMGVFGGRRDVMALLESIDGITKVFHSGTWNGHPMAMVAGIAQLESLGPREFAALGHLGETMRAKVRALAGSMGVSLQVTGLQHFSAFHYTDHPVRNRRDALRSDVALARRVSFSLLSQGFYMLGGRSNLSTAITEADIARFIDALAIAFSEAGAVNACSSKAIEPA